MLPRFCVRSLDIARLVGYEGVSGPDFDVLYPSTPSAPQNHSIVFVKGDDISLFPALAAAKECIILIPWSAGGVSPGTDDRNLVLRVQNPRLEFARAIEFALKCIRDDQSYTVLPNGAVIGHNVTTEASVRIDPLAFVDHDVSIGRGTRIHSGARIGRYVEIGRDSVIRENAVVGGDGFGFERDVDGIPVRLPHIGGVIIGGNVEVGALATIASGTICPTVIEDYVKINDHVHIAHNCTVGKASLIMACADISGSVRIGERAWIGANSSILQGMAIGAGATIGLGATVISPVDSGTTVAGNPAFETKRLRQMNQANSRLLAAVERGTI